MYCCCSANILQETLPDLGDVPLPYESWADSSPHVVVIDLQAISALC